MNNSELNQSLDSSSNPESNNRNEQARQNNTSSRDKSAPIRAPITDIRKKQSATINIDDLPVTAKLTEGIRHSGGTSKN